MGLVAAVKSIANVTVWGAIRLRVAMSDSLKVAPLAWLKNAWTPSVLSSKRR